MQKFFSGILGALLICGGSLIADVHSTREILKEHSANNEAVLDGYDRLVDEWQEYADQQSCDWGLDQLLEAVEYAALKHRGQFRKDAAKTPYIVHPIGVAELLWETGGVRSVNVLTAALLHDTLEDTSATEEEIEKLFGSQVLATVKEVTNDSTLSGEANKQRQIENAPHMSLDGQLVKLADRVYNLRDLSSPPPSWSQEKVDGYYVWGEKLLQVLPGVNAGLEAALKVLIEQHSSDSSS